MRNIAKTSHSPRNRPLIKKSSAGIVAHPKQVAPFENMMEYPPLQHIATMVVSHNGELKEPFDIIEAFIFSVRGASRFTPKAWSRGYATPFLRYPPTLPFRGPTNSTSIRSTRADQLHGENRSISDPQEALPLAKVALKAHAFGDLEYRDDTPLDLLAGLSGGFARSPISLRN